MLKAMVATLSVPSVRWSVVAACIVTVSATAVAVRSSREARALHEKVDQGLLAQERLLGEKLQLEKQNNGLSAGMMREHALYEEAIRQNAAHEKSANDLRSERYRSESLALRLRRSDQYARQLLAQRDSAYIRLRDIRADLLSVKERIATCNAARDSLLLADWQRQEAASVVGSFQAIALSGDGRRVAFKARKTREIRVNLDKPHDAGRLLRCRLIGAEGRSLAESGSIRSVEPNESSASAIDGVGSVVPRVGMERVELRLYPAKRLKPGIYRVELIVDDAMVSSLLLPLR